MRVPFPHNLCSTETACLVDDGQFNRREVELVVVLGGISPMASEVECLFMSLLSICGSLGRVCVSSARSSVGLLVWC